MKKILISMIMILSVLTACNNEEVLYSCDPEVEQWTKENIGDIQTMTRSEWLDIDDNVYRTAVYAAFTPMQKYNFWRDKLNEVLKLGWNEQEKAHILSLLDFVDKHPALFNDDTEDKDLLDVFMYAWFEKAKEDLKWRDSIIYSIGVTGEKMKDTDGSLEIAQNSSKILVKTRSEYSQNCDCNTTDDWCHVRYVNPPPGYPTITATCSNPKCNPQKKGCGWFLTASCNGRCVEKIHG